ncbi:kelch-like protein 28 [Lampetra fluviatilis]
MMDPFVQQQQQQQQQLPRLLAPQQQQEQQQQQQQPPAYTLANLAYPHSEQLLEGLNQLRQQRALCDVVLCAGAARCPAHRAVLASISPYFRAMFAGGLAHEHPEVRLRCVAEAALHAIVDFAYTGAVYVSQDTVEALLTAANLLQVRLVLKECCDFLERQLDPANCIGIARFADAHGCPELRLAARRFLQQRFEEVRRTEEFLELSPAELHEVLSSDGLAVTSEESAFGALESWVKAAPRERRAHLPALMRCVRLPLLSVKSLTRLYEANQLLRDDRACKQLLNEALRYHFAPEERLAPHASEPMARPRCAPRVLCAVGGKNGLFATLDCVEAYQPGSDTWAPLPPLAKPRYECACAVLERRLYVVGGVACRVRNRVPYGRHESSVERWDPEVASWDLAPAMTECRSTLGLAVLDGELFALGGYDGQNYLRSVERFSPRLGRWSPAEPMLKKRSCFAAAALAGMIYAVGGYGPAHLNSVERFDPGKGDWEMVAPMADKRINFGAGVAMGFLFVVGGHNGVNHLASIERYDPQLDQWTTCRPMSAPRTGVGVSVIDGFLYAVGGHSGSAYLGLTQTYDPGSDEWKDCAGMGSCRCNFGLAAL